MDANNIKIPLLHCIVLWLRAALYCTLLLTQERAHLRSNAITSYCRLFVLLPVAAMGNYYISLTINLLFLGLPLAPYNEINPKHAWTSYQLSLRPRDTPLLGPGGGLSTVICYLHLMWILLTRLLLRLVF